MNQKFKRMKDAIVKEGLYSFLYLVKQQMRESRTQEARYKQWQVLNEKPVHGSCENEPFFTVVMLGKSARDGALCLASQEYGKMEVLDGEHEISPEDILAQAKGEYIVILAKGYELAKDALHRIADKLNNDYYSKRQFLYTDCDWKDEQGGRKEPFFKPGYSPDTLRSFFYMEGLLLCRKKVFESLTFVRQRPIRHQGYMLALEASLTLNKQMFGHIPEVLCHKVAELSEDEKAFEKMGRDKQELLAAYHVHATMEQVQNPRAFRLVYDVQGEPLVSIIIPSKDNPKMLKVCLDSIAEHTKYENYEFVIVDNGGTDENRAAYQQICDAQNKPCTYIFEPMEFNFSAMCNLGARHARGEYYLFLNDDIEVAGDGTWMSRMLGQAMQPHTGAVGAKLLFPNTNRIQHAGVVNYESGAVHIFSGFSDDEPMRAGRNRLDYNYSAVTAACLMLDKEKFNEVGGFEERLAVAFNDVELCFRLLEAGYYQVLRNDVILYHHESITRGNDAVDDSKLRRNLGEREMLFALHPDMVKRDAFYGRNLTQKRMCASVNVERYMPCATPVQVDTDCLNLTDGQQVQMQQHMYCIQKQEQICARGYVFSQKWKHNNHNRVHLLFKRDGEAWCVPTQRVYNGTLAMALDSSKHLSFAEFQSYYSTDTMPAGVYEVEILVKRSFGRKNYVCKTGTEMVVEERDEMES